jgi:hypothetical protein
MSYLGFSRTFVAGTRSSVLNSTFCSRPCIGAATLSLMTFSIMTLSIPTNKMQIGHNGSVVLLSFVNAEYHKLALYDVCHILNVC